MLKSALADMGQFATRGCTKYLSEVEAVCKDWTVKVLIIDVLLGTTDSDTVNTVIN